MKIYTKYDNFKQKISNYFKVQEIPTLPFFSHPNNKSNYNLNIRYGKYNHKIIQLSPFSRFGHGLVDEQAKRIVFTSAKVGSTSIRNFAINDLQLNGDNPKHYMTHGTTLPLVTSNSFNSTSKHIISNTIYWNDYRDYQKTFVLRKPYERTISLFIDKFIKAQKYWLDAGKPFDYRGIYQLHFGYSPLIKDYAPDDLTFEHFINNLFDKFKKHFKLWDEHLSLQITSDFKEVALGETEIIRLNDLSELLKEWSMSRGIKKIKDVKDNQSFGKDALLIKDASFTPLKELLQINGEIHPDSFKSDFLENKVNEIYEPDFKCYMKNIKK